MAKSSNSKVVSFARQNHTQSDVGNPSPKDKASSKSSGKPTVKGYVYLDDPPVRPDLIIDDPTNPQNIIDGKKTRKGSYLNESQLGKATRAIGAKEDHKDKAPTQKTSVRFASPVEAPAAPHTDKENAYEKAVENSAPKGHVDRKPRSHNEEADIATPEEEISPEDIRRDVLALIKRSLRIADGVAAYMRGIEDHDVQGQRLDRDVDRVLNDRVKKRKAEAHEGKSGKVAKTVN